MLVNIKPISMVSMIFSEYIFPTQKFEHYFLVQHVLKYWNATPHACRWWKLCWSLFFFFCLYYVVMQNLLIPCLPGIQPAPHAVEAWSPNPWMPGKSQYAYHWNDCCSLVLLCVCLSLFSKWWWENGTAACKKCN